MPVTYRDDPYPAFNFEVVVNGISDDGRSVKGSFMEVSGLGVEIPAIEYRTGSEDITVRKIPGLRKFSNIVLKRGIIGDLTFWNWLLEAMNGRVRRAGGSIILLDESRTKSCAGTSSEAGPASGAAPPSTPRGTRSPSKLLRSVTKGSMLTARGDLSASIGQP